MWFQIYFKFTFEHFAQAHFTTVTKSIVSLLVEEEKLRETTKVKITEALRVRLRFLINAVVSARLHVPQVA